MAPSKGKSKSFNTPFYNYLDSLREEYEHLKREFDLMAEEIESLKQERDEYKAKVDNFICNQCSESAPALSRAKPSSFRFIRLFRFKKLRTPDKPQAVDITQTTARLLIQISPTPSLRAHSPELSASIRGPYSASNDCGSSVTFNNKVEKRLDVQMAHVLSDANQICCVNFSRDGRYLAAGCENGKAHIYDVETGTLTCVLRNLLEEEEAVRVVNFSHDGTLLATCSWDGSNLYIWKVKTKYVRSTFTGHTDFIRSLDFSPNGQFLVSASYDNTVRLWNIRGGTAKSLIEDNPTFIDEPHYRSAVFSPDGRYIAASHRDGIVRIWLVRTRQLIRRVQAHMDFVNDIAFTPDGKGLWSGSSDKTLGFWDISSLCATRSDEGLKTINASEVELHTHEQHFLAHEGGVHALAISSDGRWIASGSYDKRVHIWDTKAMQCIINHDYGVGTIDFSPASGYLASGEHNGTVKIWRYLYLAPGGS